MNVFAGVHLFSPVEEPNRQATLGWILYHFFQAFDFGFCQKTCPFLRADARFSKHRLSKTGAHALNLRKCIRNLQGAVYISVDYPKSMTKLVRHLSSIHDIVRS